MKEMEIDGMHDEILLSEGQVKCLGHVITFVAQATTEVHHRIRCAWSAFARHRQELTSQSYLLRHSLHLLDAVVSPTITCGAGTWTTAKEHEKLLRTIQRRMLTLIVQTQRKYKKKNKEDLERKDIQNEMSEDAQEEDSTNDEFD